MNLEEDLPLSYDFRVWSFKENIYLFPGPVPFACDIVSIGRICCSSCLWCFPHLWIFHLLDRSNQRFPNSALPRVCFPCLERCGTLFSCGRMCQKQLRENFLGMWWVGTEIPSEQLGEKNWGSLGTQPKGKEFWNPQSCDPSIPIHVFRFNLELGTQIPALLSTSLTSSKSNMKIWDKLSLQREEPPGDCPIPATLWGIPNSLGWSFSIPSSLPLFLPHLDPESCVRTSSTMKLEGLPHLQPQQTWLYLFIAASEPCQYN